MRLERWQQLDQLFHSSKSIITRQTIGYQIVSRLGPRGMGEVYLAEDTKLDRKVVLKILPAGAGASSQASEIPHS